MDRIFWPMLHMLSLNGGCTESFVAYLILDCEKGSNQPKLVPKPTLNTDLGSKNDPQHPSIA